MVKYRLKKDGNRLVLFDEMGKKVNVIDILSAYPERRIYAFNGQMGAGKTTLIKSLCAQMGVEDVVNSPTFAIVNVYECLSHKFSDEIYHFDCYRLKNIQEALDFGAEEYLYSGNYCFIEWPEMIEQLLPQDVVYVQISPVLTDGSGDWDEDNSERELIII